MNKLRDLVHSGAVQGVVTYEIDRFARKLAHQLLIEDEFRSQNVLVEYVLGQYDDTPEGQLQKQVRASIAEYEKEKIKERTIRGRRGRAQAGFVVPGAYATYGYTYVKGDKGHQGWFEINPAEAQVVQQIYEWYVYGDETKQKLGSRAIARKLSAMRVPTRNDGSTSHKKKRDAGIWCERTVSNILKRESYTGTHYYNRTCTVNGKQTMRDRSEWIPITIPIIIDRPLWEAAQEQAKQNICLAKRNTKHEYLLKGILKCSKCGKRFYADVDTRSTVRQYYRCCGQDSYFSNDLKTFQCSRSMKVRPTDEAAWEVMKGFLLNPRTMLQATQDETATHTTEIQVLTERLAIIEQEISSLQKQNKKLLDLFLDENSPLSKDMLTDKTKDIQRRVAALEAEATSVRRQKEQGILTQETTTWVEEFCQQVRDGIDHLTFEEQRAILMLFNVQCLLQRGATPAEDVILLSGYIPAPLATPDAVVRNTSRAVDEG